METKKIVLDQEMINRMVGCLPVSNDFTVNFTPESTKELPEEFRPIFRLKPFNHSQIKSLGKIGNNDDAALDALRKQILGWSNLYEINNNEAVEIEYVSDSQGNLDRSSVNKLSIRLSVEILNELTRISGIK